MPKNQTRLSRAEPKPEVGGLAHLDGDRPVLLDPLERRRTVESVAPQERLDRRELVALDLLESRLVLEKSRQVLIDASISRKHNVRWQNLSRMKAGLKCFRKALVLAERNAAD